MGLSHQSLFDIPTLKRGANKHHAYGAYGTAEAVPIQSAPKNALFNKL